MKQRTGSGSLATVIGDLVGSRTSADRVDLHERLRTALEEVNATLDPVRPLWVTAGDEYQGTFATVGRAVQASLLVRFGDTAVADTFCATRLAGDHRRAFGSLPSGTDAERIVARHEVPAGS